MTSTTIARQVERRADGGTRPRTLAGSLAVRLLDRAHELGAPGAPLVWPSPRYAHDINLFAREILGIRLWAKQITICEAVRDRLEVAVASGNKCGKTEVCAVIVLWYFCSFPAARVLVTAVKLEQIQAVLWKAIVRLHRQSGICLECREENERRAAARDALIERPCPHSLPVDGIARSLAKSGIHADDGREVVGFTARMLEAVSGVSGANMLYVCDEASGIDQKIFDAIEGNRMGGNVKKVLTSNPTRTEGEFFDAFNTKKDHGLGGYLSFHISGEESPNFVQRRTVIPGLASYDAIMDRRRDWGPDFMNHPLYRVRVLGQFVEREEGKILSIAVLNIAEADFAAAHDETGRWVEPHRGRLRIGIDPAGPGTAGDETSMVAVRGNRVIALQVFRGLSEEAHLVHLRGMLDELAEPGETALVAIDREGAVGIKVWGFIRAYAQGHERELVVVGVRSSDKAQREPTIYDRLRDELWAAVSKWVRSGGMLPPDPKLAAELHAPSWSSKVDGLLKATPKEEIKKKLGRSPDRADGLALAVWLREDTQEDERQGAGAPKGPLDVYEQVDSPILDPWSALSFGRGGGRRGEDE